MSNKLLLHLLTGKIKNQERFVARLKSTLTRQEQALNSAIELLKNSQSKLEDYANIEIIPNKLPFSAQRYCDDCLLGFDYGLESVHHSILKYELDICNTCYAKLLEPKEE